MNALSNKPIVLLLTGGIAACIALLPWGRLLADAPDPEARLTQRVAEYAKLRQQDDWLQIYAMMDARDRKAVPLPRFLTLYGRGSLKTISLVEKAREVDLPKGMATVVMTLEAELQLDKLPAERRRSLGPQDPAQLRKSADFATEWFWDEGAWWLRMDVEAVTGRSADGKDIKPAGG